MPADAPLPFDDAESLRLREDEDRRANWKRWGPYLSERQWGTVREDYSADGDAWGHFPHDHARSRTYRWGEDGLLGWCDRQGRLCFAVALWNGVDPILKERLFGLTGPEGNHGEDVKELYYYLDSTPTHSYAKALYKYPQREYPYRALVEAARARGHGDPELDILETGVFSEDRYFDVTVEYAKASSEDILIRITIDNRGPEAATLHLLPTLWLRNTWSWGRTGEGYWKKGALSLARAGRVLVEHESLGRLHFDVESTSSGAPRILFTENETNKERLYGAPNASPWAKDGFHRYVIDGETGAVCPYEQGTKCAPHYVFEVPGGGRRVVRMRLRPEAQFDDEPLGDGFDGIFTQRIAEAEAFYARRIPAALGVEERRVARQAYAGLLWSKQFFHFIVRHWLEGDPNEPPPPAERTRGRNADWGHLFNRDVISMPDKWEYPWYAAWDLAFHMLAFARIDIEFAKSQLILFLREWYMHPNGQIPAYEWKFADVNPPVHAWAAFRIYKMSGPPGQRDVLFLKRVFSKLLLNFNWWVNRKDPEGNNLFGGGFLGLDNIGIFDRSKPLPTGGHLEQADGTAWMAFYCVTMLGIALELARDDASYEDLASKFFEHFLAITDAMNGLGGTGLWSEEDGFYYDQLSLAGRHMPLRIRSMVGLLPLIAAEVLDESAMEKLPGFAKRTRWFIENRQDVARHITYMTANPGTSGARGEDIHGHATVPALRGRLLAVPSRERLTRVLGYMLNPPHHESRSFS
jgi:hypothetical protein